MNHTPSAHADAVARHADHVATLQQRAARTLSRCGYDALLIASGVQKTAFLDDKPYVFQPNPHFNSWVPVFTPHCWLLVRPGLRPVLAYYQPDDYWHVPPSAPQGAWTEQVDILLIDEPSKAVDALLPLVGGADAIARGRVAIVGEADAALKEFVPRNPGDVLASLAWFRGTKTPHELHCLREASRVGARAHLAARDAFHAGGSEAEIHRAYLLASGHTDRDLPYANIVGLNEHCAVLHYQHQEVSRPATRRSFLIDAGAQVQGYASDITRTWAGENAHPVFEALLAAMDEAQRRLVDQVRDGVDYRRIHLAAHREVATMLADAGIVSMGSEAMVEEGITSVFFPHGIGHLLGLQVHDVGGFMADELGERTLPKPEGHPYLRLTRTLAAGMTVTIEPGLYFIAPLLEKLRAHRAASRVDWALIDVLVPCGGIRIEDDVCCRANGAPENLTRDAFAGVSR